ncbi:MAG: helix-turn-helix domain-containing protein [Candidatus Limnocylindrales bacterium]
MSTREGLASRGSRLAHADLVRLGAELRAARVGAGLSLARVGQAVGLSKSHVGRIEHAQVANVGVRYLTRLGAVLGLDIRIKAYPGGDALRDAGHIRLGSRFRRRLHPRIRARSEQVLPGEGDARAWDLWPDRWVDSRDARGVPAELETRVTDYQSLIRRMHRKMRDGGVSTVLLVVADTPSNRRAVAAAGDQVTSDFPVSARSAFASLAAGERPHGSCLIFI